MPTLKTIEEVKQENRNLFKLVVAYVLFIIAATFATIWAVGWAFGQIEQVFCSDSALRSTTATAGITCDIGAKLEVTPKGEFVCRCRK